MRTDTSPTISRHAYQPYPYRLPAVTLRFELDSNVTRVQSHLRFERVTEKSEPLILSGEELTLESVRLDGKILTPDQYRLDNAALTLFPSSAEFTVEIASLCKPADNSTLMGLYVSGKNLFTQCEAEGFRRITWFPDRPDVMSCYRVELCADKTHYPLLLSNGNLVQTQDLTGNLHEAIWTDPHPKPCYLFALVAGEFSCREQSIQTQGGRNALLQVYSDPDSRAKTAWALECLAHAVKWDEQRFGLELDLDRFMVVAARDFNMGAMENKGLNIFNSSYVLADPDTATDAGYHAIEAVIGHEYFHNWTGNRVTCRDWFQLSLKEGLTVFRDQEFSADMLAMGLSENEAKSARAVKRIDDVNTLRIAQFPEDAGPMAHPIRPESYQEIANFYTATVYEKGAEVIRMQQTLLGVAGFRRGLDEYFRRHDGSAVTCDDFVDAMESVYTQQNPGKDLSVFRRWYSQAGTPRVAVAVRYDEAARSCSVTLKQRCAAVGIERLQSPPRRKEPLHIPFALGLLDQKGRALPLHYQDAIHDTVILDLCTEQQTWVFTDIPEAPVPSLLRNFSAPVIVDYDRNDEELRLLTQFDSDPYARWEAGQELATRQLLALVGAMQANQSTRVSPDFIDTWRALLLEPTLTAAYRTRALTLPAEKTVLEKTNPMDAVSVARARIQLRRILGVELAPLWLTAYQQASVGSDGDYQPDALSAGRRALKNLALGYLVAGRHEQGDSLALAQYRQATNLTDRLGALSALVNWSDTPATTQALDHFYEQWQHDPLAVDKWFALQATAPATTVASVRALMLHPAFTLRNPNRARSLVFQFCMNNMLGIHTPDGYDFWAEQVIVLDQLNPEIAARLARSFDNWDRFVPDSRTAIQSALRRIQQHDPLSRNVAEIVSKALDS